MSDRKVILDNIYFIMYLDGEEFTNVHLDSKPKEIQEKYDSNDVLSHEKKIEMVDQILEYFYNFWKLIESSKDTKQYTMYFNINLVMINIPLEYFSKMKTVLDSLKPVIQTNLKETYFKVENNLAKYFLDLLLTFYKPIKKIHII